MAALWLQQVLLSGLHKVCPVVLNQCLFLFKKKFLLLNFPSSWGNDSKCLFSCMEFHAVVFNLSFLNSRVRFFRSLQENKLDNSCFNHCNFCLGQRKQHQISNWKSTLVILIYREDPPKSGGRKIPFFSYLHSTADAAGKGSGLQERKWWIKEKQFFEQINWYVEMGCFVD